MDDAPALRLSMPLPLPQRGGLVRARCGPCEALLERVRGGFAFVWSDGRRAERLHLGLGGGGELLLELRAPEARVAITPQDPVVVGPGARVRGYVLAPLVPTLVWRRADGGVTPLHAFVPETLAAEWRAGAGHGFATLSPWCARFPARAASQLQAVLPVRVRNDGRVPHEVAAIPFAAHSGLRACRGGLVFDVADLAVCGDGLAPHRRDRVAGLASTDAAWLELPA
jgi:hypothetical protein